jgi:hypothetical protein
MCLKRRNLGCIFFLCQKTAIEKALAFTVRTFLNTTIEKVMTFSMTLKVALYSRTSTENQRIY